MSIYTRHNGAWHEVNPAVEPAFSLPNVTAEGEILTTTTDSYGWAPSAAYTKEESDAKYATEEYVDSAVIAGGPGGGPAPGLVHLYSGQITGSSMSINDIFSTNYDFYRVHVRLTESSANLQLRCRTQLSGVMDEENVYYTSSYYVGTTGASAGNMVGGVTTVGWEIFDATDPNDTNSQGYFDLSFPFSGKRKQGTGMFSQQNPGAVNYGITRYFNKVNTTDFDGLTFFTNTGTVTGSISIYGYSKVGNQMTVMEIEQ